MLRTHPIRHRLIPALKILLLAACSDPVQPPPPEAPARIELSETALTLAAVEGGDDPAPIAVAIANAGEATLTGLQFRIEYDEAATGWLEASFDGTTAPATLTVSSRIDALDAGQYEAELHVLAAGAANSPQTIGVSLEVEERPVAAPTNYTLNLLRTPREGGRVGASPAGREHEAGTVVTLAADPNPGYRFVRWSGDASGSDSEIEVVMDRDREVVGTFEMVPPRLEARVSGEDIVLTWTYRWPCIPDRSGTCRPSGQESYELQESTISGRDGFQTVFASRPTREEEFTHRVSKDPGTYYFRVRAGDPNWMTPFSEVVTVRVEEPDPGPPAAASNLQVSSEGLVLTVSWNDNSNNEDGFRVEVQRRNQTSDHTFEEVVDRGVTTLVWEDTSFSEGNEWNVRVIAFNDDGESAATDDAWGYTRSPHGRLILHFTHIDYQVRSVLMDGEELCTRDPCDGASDLILYDGDPGTHEYEVIVERDLGNGVWEDAWTFTGTIELRAAQRTRVYLEYPPLADVLTDGAESRWWDGEYTDPSGATRTASLQIFRTGTVVSYRNGAEVGFGRVEPVDADGDTLAEEVAFTVIGESATLFNLFDRIQARNGPPSSRLITYTPR